MNIRVNIARPEDMSPLPITRPAYAEGTVTGCGPDWSNPASIALEFMSSISALLSPHSTVLILPEKFQVKFKEDPTNPLTYFPSYGVLN